MLAVDTDVIVRLLAADHPEQSPRARGFIEANPVWIATTVLLEAEWVLRAVYRFAPTAVGAALRALAGLPTVTLEHPGRVATALGWLDAGLDFADALHLAAAGGQAGFVTFDARLIAAAPADGPPVRAP